MVKQRIKIDNGKPSISLPEITGKTEETFKRILKVMTWVVGICFLLIIGFHLFNNQVLDSISKILYYIVITILIGFTVLEFKADKIKIKIQKFTETPS